jgi:hypothetical protein
VMELVRGIKITTCCDESTRLFFGFGRRSYRVAASIGQALYPSCCIRRHPAGGTSFIGQVSRRFKAVER